MREMVEYQKRIDLTLMDLGIPSELIQMRRLPIYLEANEIGLAEISESGKDQKLIPLACAAWQRMKAAAEIEGVDIRLVSAFRSFDRQSEIIRRKIENGHSMDEILAVSAPPGYSEHHTGRAIDIGTPNCQNFEEHFENTAAFSWLQLNAGQFGFSLSFPRGNPFGFCYEPWHWCYK